MRMMKWLFLVTISTIAPKFGNGKEYGYELAFPGPVSIASPQKGFFNFSDDGLKELSINMTCTAWIRWDQLNQASPSLPISWMSPMSGNLFQPFNYNQGFFFDTSVSFTLPEGFNPFEWHHFAAVITDHFVQVFVDGENIASVTVANSVKLVQEDVSLIFGAHTYSRIDSQLSSIPSRSLWGALEEVVFWSRALTVEELNQVRSTPIRAMNAQLRDGAFLAYNFDLLGCNADAPSLSAYTQSCSGADGQLVSNLGSAGTKYDLLLGQTNDDYGFGHTWVDSESPSQCPEPQPFVQSRLVRSTLNVEGATTTDELSVAPYVLYVAIAGTVSVPLPQADVTSIQLYRAPFVGTISLTSDAVPLVASADVSAESALVYTASENMADYGDEDFDRVIFNVVPNSGPAFFWHVHIWKLTEPYLATQPTFAVLESREYLMKLGSFGKVDSGEALTVVIASLPSTGTLFQVEPITGEKVQAILAPNVSLTNPSGTVLFMPDPDKFARAGTDTFEIAFKSTLSNQVSPMGVVTLEAILVDDLPVSNASQVTTVEDSEDGVTFDLETLDKDGLVTIAIDMLPQKGFLYTVDSTGKTQLITSDYNIYDVGKGIKEQYVYDVLRVSSFWGSPPYTGYHALNVIGSPTCAGTVGECPDFRFQDLSKDLLVGDLVRANRYQGEERDPVWVLARITQHVGGSGLDARYDVHVMPMQKIVDGQYQPCVMNGTSYPDKCITDIPGTPYLISAIKRSDLKEIENGVWCPLMKAYVGDVQLTGGENSAAYGPNYDYVHTQSDFYKGNEFVAYTEWIEVEYLDEVYPVGVEIGMPRGGGAVVGIKARDPDGGWHHVWTGGVQKHENEITNGRGYYFQLDQLVCRTPFKTKAIRVELDTSEETGIGSWNYVDYIKLIGAAEIQSSILPFKSRTVRYVPSQDLFGEDSFSFAAFDCLGDRLRSPGSTTVSVFIEPQEDMPSAKSPSEEKSVYVYVTKGKQNGGEELALLGKDVDFDPVEISVSTLPTFGTLLQNGQPIQVGAALETQAENEFQKASISFLALECGDYGYSVGRRHTFLVRDSFNYSVSDSNGNIKIASVELMVQCEDLGYDSTLARGCYIFSGINWAFCLVCITWTIAFRSHLIVRAAQAPFLLVLIVGAAVSSSTIIPLTVTDSSGPLADENGGNSTADQACMSSVWLYTMGFAFTFAPLFAKMERVSIVFANARQMKRTSSKSIKLSATRLAQILAKFTLGEFLIVVIWTTVDPLKYKRTVLITDNEGNSLKSAGQCTSDSSLTFVAILGVYHVLVLLWGANLCRKTYGINTAFSEAKYVTIGLISNLQVLLLGIPVVAIASETPAMSTFVRSGVVFLNDFGVLCVMFLPKMWFMIHGFETSGEGASILGSSNHTKRTSSVTPTIIPATSAAPSAESS